MKQNKNRHKPTAREQALAVLVRIEKGGAYSDRVLSSPMIAGLSSRDAAFARELVLGIIRWQGRLDRIIQAFARKDPSGIDLEVFNVIRMGLYQILFMNSVPEWAAVNESVALARKRKGKGAGGLVNAMLRRFLRDGEPPLPADDVARLSVEYSHPEWLVARWIGNYGTEATVEILKAGVEYHPVGLRIAKAENTESVMNSLRKRGINPIAVENMAGYLILPKAEGVFDTTEFRSGKITVQDPAAGLPVGLLEPQENDTILDLCAAPGGKTTHIADILNGTGTVIAVDSNESRLNLVRDATRRLGLENVETVVADARTFTSEMQFDRVLVDVPCSGTGVLSKRPEIKWRLSERAITGLVEVQRAILENAAKLVTAGGTVVYSTCTLEPEENEHIIEWFLGNHPEFVFEKSNLFAHFEIGCGYRILPNAMYGAGSFAAKLKKLS